MLMFALVWKKRDVKSAKPLSGFLLAAGEWALASAFETAVPAVSQKVFWAVISYIGISTTPVFFFLFTLSYSQFDRFVPSKYWKYFFILPAITILTASTNQYHHLLWSKFTFETANILTYWYGPYFWISVLYTYLLLSAGTIILLFSTFKFRDLYRNQMILFIIASALPFASNMIYILKIPILIGFDLTPISFAICSSIIGLVILKYNFLDIVPIAHHIIFENINSAILVLNEDNRVIDTNSTFLNWINTNLKIGNNFATIKTSEPTLVKICEENTSYDGELKLSNYPNNFFRITINEIPAPGKNNIPKIVIINDITQLKRKEDELIKKNEALNNKITEIENLKNQLEDQAIKDPLTGIYNRRHLESTLNKEISRSKREFTEFAIMMIDIDFFKNINDIDGHNAGDNVLIEISKEILKCLRNSDYLFRYGGDEMAILITNINRELALKKGNHIRKMVENLNKTIFNYTQKVTLSIGIAVYPENGNTTSDILKNADKALYKAKSDGRNKAVLYKYEDR